MKRFAKNVIIMMGVMALMAVFTIPAEAGRRHHCRVTYVVPPHHVEYRPHHDFYHYGGVQRVYVSRPVVIVPVPRYRVYYGPSVYVHGYVW